MAIYDIEMQKRNAANTAWDKLHPITKAANVFAADGVTTLEKHLENSAHVAGKIYAYKNLGGF